MRWVEVSSSPIKEKNLLKNEFKKNILANTINNLTAYYVYIISMNCRIDRQIKTPEIIVDAKDVIVRPCFNFPDDRGI